LDVLWLLINLDYTQNPPIEYTVYKRLLGRYNDLYSMWQQTITENAPLRQQLQARRIPRKKETTKPAN
jgi:hypothetical protein